ncbi:LysR family transcriptional regulator [Pseudoxanthomonas sp. z9]|uniref:LysR family transcriptional regulator n=1 Tax=Pseudoxanthomonas sp. z9 TaxID=2584942 RepID=UPI0011431600|nr:LysR family transcriptional regulator [Pseudoxanthomonas sp. z9]
MSIDWDDLETVLAIVRGGSLSAAARAMGTTQPTIGRRLDALERRLGAQLFEREAGGMRPTPLAHSLLDGLERMEAGAQAIQRQVAARDTGLSGEILVTSLDWLGDEVIAPMLARFASRHPGVLIELVNDTRVFNLARREADLAFRFGAFAQDNLVDRPVGNVAYALYASTDYLQRHGTPDPADGMAGHQVVLLDRAAGDVPHESGLRGVAHRARTVLHGNGLRTHLAVAREGIAMAVLPCLLGDREAGLHRMPVAEARSVRAVRVGYHADMRDTPRLRALIDFIVREFEVIAARLDPAG